MRHSLTLIGFCCLALAALTPAADWIPTPPMSTVRSGASVVRLADGRVLVSGGMSGATPDTALASCEIYDPATGTWSATGSMSFQRSRHCTVLLADGRVMAISGESPKLEETFLVTPRIRLAMSATPTCEIWSPTTRTWSVAANIGKQRSFDHTAILQTDGRVLVIGGTAHSTDIYETVGTWERYNPVTGSWSPASPDLGWCGPHAFRLSDGRVIAEASPLWYKFVTNSELFPTFAAPPVNDQVVLLADNRILAVGSASAPTACATLNPAPLTWTAQPGPSAGHLSGGMATLGSGLVLLAGGFPNSTSPVSSSCALFSPNPAGIGSWAPMPAMIAARSRPLGLVPIVGGALIIGGAADQAACERFVYANAPPTVAVAAIASPDTPIQSDLIVLGADDGGESNLTYTWSTLGIPPGPVSFSVNGTHAASRSVATFTKTGAYSLQCTIRDALGLTVKSSVMTTVSAAITITLQPASVRVNPWATQQFTSSVVDQFGAAVVPRPILTWSVSGGGSISATGFFTAASAVGGPFTVSATSGGSTGSASVWVNVPPTVAFASNASRKSEAGGTHLVRLGLDQIARSPIQVSLTTGGTATQPADYTCPSVVTIPVGESSIDVPITLVDDALEEGDETVVVTVQSAVGANPGAARVHTLTINDNDGAALVEPGIPGFSNPPGNYIAPIALEITGVPQAEIWYTIGAAPVDPVPGASGAIRANGPIAVAASTVIKAVSTIHIGSTFRTGAVVSAAYSIQPLSGPGFTSTTTSFAVSPACLEMSLPTADLVLTCETMSNGRRLAQAPVTVLGPKASYANVPLDPSGPVTVRLTATDRGGNRQIFERTCFWTVTDLERVGGATITLREGDRLRLAAGIGGEIDTGVLPKDSQFIKVDGSGVVVSYLTTGVFSPLAYYNGRPGQGITVSVVRVDMDPREVIAAEVITSGPGSNFARAHSVHSLPSANVVGFFPVDPTQLTVTPSGGSYEWTDLALKPLVKGQPMFVARIGGAKGPIVGAKAVTSFARAPKHPIIRKFGEFTNYYNPPPSYSLREEFQLDPDPSIPVEDAAGVATTRWTSVDGTVTRSTNLWAGSITALNQRDAQGMARVISPARTLSLPVYLLKMSVEWAGHSPPPQTITTNVGDITGDGHADFAPFDVTVSVDLIPPDTEVARRLRLRHNPQKPGWKSPVLDIIPNRSRLPEITSVETATWPVEFAASGHAIVACRPIFSVWGAVAADLDGGSHYSDDLTEPVLHGTYDVTIDGDVVSTGDHIVTNAVADTALAKSAILSMGPLDVMYSGRDNRVNYTTTGINVASDVTGRDSQRVAWNPTDQSDWYALAVPAGADGLGVFNVNWRPSRLTNRLDDPRWYWKILNSNFGFDKYLAITKTGLNTISLPIGTYAMDTDNTYQYLVVTGAEITTTGTQVSVHYNGFSTISPASLALARSRTGLRVRAGGSQQSVFGNESLSGSVGMTYGGYTSPAGGGQGSTTLTFTSLKSEECILTLESGSPTRIFVQGASGLGAPTTGSRHSPIGSHGSVEAGGNLFWSIPVIRYRTPAMGPDLVLSYNSFEPWIADWAKGGARITTCASSTTSNRMAVIEATPCSSTNPDIGSRIISQPAPSHPWSPGPPSRPVTA